MGSKARVRESQGPQERGAEEVDAREGEQESSENQGERKEARGGEEGRGGGVVGERKETDHGRVTDTTDTGSGTTGGVDPRKGSEEVGEDQGRDRTGKGEGNEDHRSFREVGCVDSTSHSTHLLVLPTNPSEVRREKGRVPGGERSGVVEDEPGRVPFGPTAGRDFHSGDW